MAFDESKFVISGLSSPILKSASNQSHPKLFLQLIFTLAMHENIRSNFAFVNGTAINNSHIISTLGHSCCMEEFENFMTKRHCICPCYLRQYEQCNSLMNPSDTLLRQH